jgi:hypothetical protein
LQLISVRAKRRGKSRGWSAAAARSSKEGPYGLYRRFGVSVLGIFTYNAFYFGDYDSGKTFIWGSEERAKQATFLYKFAFAQFVTSTS